MNQYNHFINICLTYENLDRFYHRTSILHAIKKILPCFSGSLLDAGCGKMPYKEFILANSQVYRYIGLDIDSALNYQGPEPDYTWDGKTMPFDDSTFDCVMATEVLEHVPEPAIYLHEVRRVLREDGIFFFTVPFLWPLHETPHDEYRYTPYAMERILSKAGFQEIKLEALGGWHASMAQMLGLWLKRSPLSHRKKRILSVLLLPFYKQLIKLDRKVISEGQMITGLSGMAIKKS